MLFKTQSHCLSNPQHLSLPKVPTFPLRLPNSFESVCRVCLAIDFTYDGLRSNKLLDVHVSYSYMPHLAHADACNAAEESHQILGASTLSLKPFGAKLRTYTALCPQHVGARSSVSPELVAGTPACVMLFVSTTVPARTITSPELLLRVFSQSAHSLFV